MKWTDEERLAAHSFLELQRK